MSGDNLHGKQPDIRYSVKVHHHEEWEEMTFEEKMRVMGESIKNWEKDYLQSNRSKLSDREIEILQGSDLKAHEGMIYGRMYFNWKKEVSWQH